MSVKELLLQNQQRISEKFEGAYFQNEPQAVAVFSGSVEIFKKDNIYLHAASNLGDPILFLYSQSMAASTKENFNRMLEKAEECDAARPKFLKTVCVE